MSNFHWLTGIEDTFIPHAEPGKRKLDEYELMNHYTLWKEDIDLMVDLGVDMARYGIPWYKVEPAPGRFDWAWTDQVLGYMVEKGITPVIDLMHYGTPLWLDNLFLNNRYPERVAAYAEAFARRYQDTIHWYTPLNEPFINALFCGETGWWPPHLKGDHGYVTLLRPIMRGMILTEQAIKAIDPQAKFLQVDASALVIAANLNDDELVNRATFINERMYLAYDLLAGKVDGGHFLSNYLQEHGMTDAELDWHRTNLGTFDYLGVNFYPHLSVHELYRVPKTDPHPTLLPEIRQRSIWGSIEQYKQVLRNYWHRYQAPIIHTESSATNDPETNIKWMNESLKAVQDIRAEGVRLEGYTWWPLYDLIDWEYRYGSEPVEHYVRRMGLYQLEMGFDGQFKRVRTEAVDHFKRHVAQFDPGPIGNEIHSPHSPVS